MMLIDVGFARLQLDKEQHVWLRGALDTRLTPVSGTAWITFDRDHVDIVLHPGQDFVVPRGRTVLIGPLHGSLTLDARTQSGAAGRDETRDIGVTAAPALQGGYGSVSIWPLKGLQ